jgi:Fe2+ or Zn2+ uptake regulation protein
VSLATVYRNLRTLAAEGLLRERAEATGLRFDGNTAPHDHFTCVACGAIFDVPRTARGAGARDARAGEPSGAGRRVGLAAARMGFEVLEQRVELYGRCRACRPPSAPRRGRRARPRPIINR